MQIDERVEELLRLQPRQRSALANLGIRSVRDLIFHFPSRYEEIGEQKRICDLREGEGAAVIAEVVRLKAEKTWRRKLNIAEGVVKDDTGLLGVVWFNQPYVANMLKPGMMVRLSGRVSRGKNGLTMANPLFEPAAEDKPGATAAGGLLPVYPETYGITSRWFRYQIERALKAAGLLADPLPRHILERYRLPGLNLALRAMHFPKNAGEAEAARKRFAFEEIFIVQLDRQRLRKKLEQERGVKIKTDAVLLERFASSLPFRLTGSQQRAIRQISDDFAKPHPMARLLEGDVGSGKTLVAAACSLEVASAGYQTAYMAPTEILARQHFDEFIRRLAGFGIKIGLLTGSEARKFPSRVRPGEHTHVSKSQLLKWCQSGEIQILIGTHALIEKSVKFKNLAFVVVDEQHRFGVSQRRRAAKDARPHFLSMSATPIPRTLALTIYGDLDLTVLDEMPPGREPVETRIVPPRERERAYDFMREEIQRGGQAFVICPRIEDPSAAEADKSGVTGRSQASTQQKLEWAEVKSVKTEYEKLAKEIFPDLKVGMIHGRLKPLEKETVMKKFKSREFDILVSTSVVEVGVDVPNASIMMIEGAERFGLAQLHQFRGRVGRGSRKSSCLVFTTGQDYGNNRRLKALEEAKTGFELAEYDLKFRGPGELSGIRQWGVSDVGMEALKNIKMVEAARGEAQSIIAEDAELSAYPLLRERVENASAEAHFE